VHLDGPNGRLYIILVIGHYNTARVPADDSLVSDRQLLPQYFRNPRNQFGRRERLLQECKVAIQFLDVIVRIT
jgi:hypothetical protein